MSKDVFLSYCSRDESFADAACAFLENRGVTCWIAPRDVSPGAVFDEAIIDAIESTQALVLILSGSANDSPFVKNEVNRAFAKGKAIFTFRIEEVTPGKALEFYLARHHWTDGFPPPLEERFNRLANAILALLGKAATLQVAPVRPEPQMAATAPPLASVSLVSSRERLRLPETVNVGIQLDYPQRLALDDDRVFVAGNTDRSGILLVYDTANRECPSLLKKWSMGDNMKIVGVSTTKGFVFVRTDVARMLLLDIRNPAAIVISKSFGGYGKDDGVNNGGSDICICGEVLVDVNSLHAGGLHDISHLPSVRCLGECNFPGAKRVSALDDSHCIVASEMQIGIVGVGSKYSHGAAILETYEPENALTRFRDCAGTARHVCLATTSGIELLEWRQGAPCLLKEVVEISPPPDFVNISGNTIVSTTKGGILRIHQITNTSGTITQLMDVDLSGQSLGEAHLKDSYLYVSCQSGLRVVGLDKHAMQIPS
jgi:hypothetical protein